MFGDRIQPFMEHTIDFPDSFDREIYQSAIEHVKKYIDTDFVFNVMYTDGIAMDTALVNDYYISSGIMTPKKTIKSNNKNKKRLHKPKSIKALLILRFGDQFLTNFGERRGSINKDFPHRMLAQCYPAKRP